MHQTLTMRLPNSNPCTWCTTLNLILFEDIGDIEAYYYYYSYVCVSMHVLSSLNVSQCSQRSSMEKESRNVKCAHFLKVTRTSHLSSMAGSFSRYKYEKHYHRICSLSWWYLVHSVYLIGIVYNYVMSWQLKILKFKTHC